jgi:hypothetical protein
MAAAEAAFFGVLVVCATRQEMRSSSLLAPPALANSTLPQPQHLDAGRRHSKPQHMGPH